MGKDDLSSAEIYLYGFFATIGVALIVVATVADFPDKSIYPDVMIGLGTNLVVLTIVFAFSLHYSRKVEAKRRSDLIENIQVTFTKTITENPNIKEIHDLLEKNCSEPVVPNNMTQQFEQFEIATKTLKELSERLGNYFDQVQAISDDETVIAGQMKNSLDEAQKLSENLRDTILYIEGLLPVERLSSSDETHDENVPKELLDKLKGKGRTKPGATPDRPYYKEDS